MPIHAAHTFYRMFSMASEQCLTIHNSLTKGLSTIYVLFVCVILRYGLRIRVYEKALESSKV